MQLKPVFCTNHVQWLVYSDLDGTLLDHDSYSFEEARPALSLLAERRIPLILVSSKTGEELVQVRSRIGSSSPLAAENGAAIYIDGPSSGTVFNSEGELMPVTLSNNTYHRYSPGRPRSYWYEALANADADLRDCFTSFSEMGTEGIVLETGLTAQQASAANKRVASEPIQWRSGKKKLKRFERYIRSLGGQVTRGGRFLHIQDATPNKGTALNWIKRQYQLNLPAQEFRTIALGDAPNDAAMLCCADQAVWIRSNHHDVPQHSGIRNAIISGKPGPSGWNEVILKLMNK